MMRRRGGLVRAAATDPPGEGSSRHANTSNGMKRIAPRNAAMNTTTAILSAKGCARCSGGWKRSIRIVGFVRARTTMLATVATKNTAMSTHARHQSKRPGG